MDTQMHFTGADAMASTDTFKSEGVVKCRCADVPTCKIRM